MLRMMSTRKSIPNKARRLLAEGDAARDRLHWKEAANAYRLFLAERPEVSAIWIQFGHALKESDDLVEAERAYSKAIDLAPRVADARLQMGHLYKVTSRYAEALLSYEVAYFLDPTSKAARDEVLNTRAHVNGVMLEHFREQTVGPDSAVLARLLSTATLHEPVEALERRFNAVVAQLEHILGHVAITKALGAELARLSRRVEQIGVAVLERVG